MALRVAQALAVPVSRLWHLLARLCPHQLQAEIPSST
jgi:hypothetical protein